MNILVSRSCGSLMILICGLLPLQALYRIPVSVFGNGGTVLSSENLLMTGTAGQTLCGESTSPSNKNCIGFWYSNQYFVTTDVEGTHDQLPETYSLLQNYPNPFNPVSVIEYTIPEISEVTITVYDILGRQAAILFHGFHVPGLHKVLFQPDQLPSGVYFYRMTAKSLKSEERFSEVKKAMYIR
jgi:hypothetical protein